MYAIPSLSTGGLVIKATGCPGGPRLKKASACRDFGEISCLFSAPVFLMTLPTTEISELL